MDLGHGQQCLQCNDCPGFFEHTTWRKVCQHCRCPFEAHEITDSSMMKLVSDFQRHCGSASDNDSGCPIEGEYIWMPQGLKPEQVHQYFSCLPENKVPYINSIGEQHRMRQLLWQCPPQDTDSKHCSLMTESETLEHEKFNDLLRSKAKGRGVVRTIPLTMQDGSCHQCKGEVKAGQIAVFAADVLWHPACFTCQVCTEQLVDLLYFHKQNQQPETQEKEEINIYCGRHFAELHKPRCTACDEMIFADECTEAEDRCWHMKHFACFQCNVQLGGQRYVMKQDKPYCCKCFETCFSEFCDSCDEQIFVDQPQINHGGQRWHATKRCFRCFTCCKPLLGLPFLPKNEVTYCSKDCSLGLNADSANDSLSSNSKDDIRSLLKKTEKLNMVDSATVDRQSDGYGSLLTHSERSRVESPQSETPHIEPIYENASRFLSRSISVDPEPTRPTPPSMSKSVTFAALSSLLDDDSGHEVMNPINRPPRYPSRKTRRLTRAERAERAERQTIKQKHEHITPPAIYEESASSSDESDGDLEYEAAVARAIRSDYHRKSPKQANRVKTKSCQIQ